MAVINGTAGADNLVGTADNDTINGLAGADTINGGAGNDIIQGGAGADLIDGGTGADTLIGGTEDDIYLIDDANDQVIENTNEGTDIVRTTVSYVLTGSQSIETLEAIGSAAINLTGNELGQTIRGNAANNVIDGGLGAADGLVGGLGDDTYLVRNAGDVVLENAGQGNDTVFVAASAGATYALTAGQEIETLSAAVQADTTALSLTGNEFSQTIIGNQGTNTLAGGGTSVDTLIGLGGDDTYTVTVAGTTVIEAAGGGTDTVNTTVDFSAGTQSIENIIGSGAGPLILTGGAGDQSISGSTGADILNGGGGNDTLVGGTGADTYIVDGGDTITETAGNGTDTVITSAAITLGNAASVENLFATGSVRFTATGAANTFNINSYGFDTVDGTRNLNSENTSTASVPFLNGNNTAQLIVGNASDNILDGNRLAGVAAGGVAAALANNALADTLSGLAGNDTYRVYSQADVVLEDSNGGRDSVFTSGSYSLATNDTNAATYLNATFGVGTAASFYSTAQIEVLSTAVNADTTNGINLTGNTYGQIIVGNFGDNVIVGGGTSAGGGTDVLIGLSGNDTYQIDSLNTVVFEDAGRGTDFAVVTAAASGFTLNTGSSVEVLFAGAASGTVAADGTVTGATTSADTATIAIVGNELSQTIYGNAGVNSLASGGGAPDTLVGGLGNDSYRVSNTLDTIVEVAGGAAPAGQTGGDAAGFDSLFTTGISYNLAAGVSIEYLSTVAQGSTENISLVGNNLAQTIVGNFGDNILDSDQGAITGQGVQNQLAALGVGDTLQGLGGNDTYRVYSQNDVVVEIAGQGTDTVLTSASYNLSTNNTNVSTLNGAASVSSIEVLSVESQVSTTAGISLVGAGGAQSIIGNDAANTINGGSGSDTLTGRGGSDTFAFTTALGATNVDTITDFTAGDLIGLGSPFGAAAADGITADEFFVVGQGTQTAAQFLVYNQTSGQLFYDADGNGSGAAVLFAQLTAGTAIGFNSFVAYTPVLADTAV